MTHIDHPAQHVRDLADQTLAARKYYEAQLDEAQRKTLWIASKAKADAYETLKLKHPETTLPVTIQALHHAWQALNRAAAAAAPPPTTPPSLKLARVRRHDESDRI
jgi:hypothetical protein